MIRLPDFSPRIFVPVLMIVAFLLPGQCVRAQVQANPLDSGKRAYVPIEELDTILSRDKQGVVLPRKEFLKLLEDAKKNAGDPARLIVSLVEYQATIKDSHLLLAAKVHFEQFSPGWHTLELKTGSLSIESATLGNAQPPLGRTGAGVAYLLTNEPGEHVLSLTLSTPLASVGSDQVSLLSLLPSPSATFTIDLPPKKQLAVDGVLIDRREANDQAATIEFPVGGRDKLELRITERQRTQQSDALVFMTTAYGVNVAPSEITWQAVTTLQSFGESLDRFTFVVPNTLEIAAVESTGLESWELNDSKDRRSTEITLTYRQPIDGSRKVTFRGVMAVPVNEQWSLPGLRLANAASEIGRVVVQHPVGTRLVIESMDGVRRTKDESTKSKLAQATFDIWQRDFNLQLRLQLREREVLTNMSTVLDVNENTVRFETLAGIECLNAPLFEVVASIPLDWEPTSITLNDVPVQWRIVPREAGRQYLRIPFPGPLQPGGENKLKISAVQNLRLDADGKSAFSIPDVAIEGAGVVEGVILVRPDAWLRVTPEDLEGLDPAVLPGAKSEHPGFRYQSANFSGSITVEPRTTRLIAWTQSYTRLDPKRAITWLDLHLNVKGGGLREVEVQLPESLGEKLRFAIVRNCSPAARIREQVARDAVDGNRTWIIRFDRRVRGSVTLGAFLEEDRVDTGNRIPEAHVPNADRQYGFIAIEASAEQHLTITTGQETKLQNVDPIDLPESVYRPKERIVAAYRYVRPGFQMTATEERFDREAVPTAVCRLLEVQTVVGKAGQLRHRTTMTFVAVGVQNLRMLLPEHLNLWSTEIDGQPVEVRRDDDAYLIPLRTSEAADAERVLNITYETTTDAMTVLGRFRHSAPTFRVDVGGSDQPIETLARTWEVVHSADTVFDASNGLFEPTTDLGEQGILARLPGTLSLPGQQTAADKLLAIGVVIVLVVLPTLSFRRWRWPGLIACGAVLLIGFSFLSASSVLNERMANRYDIEFMGGTDAQVATEAAPRSIVSGVMPNDPFAQDAETDEAETAPPRLSRRRNEPAPAAAPNAAPAIAQTQDAPELPSFGSRQLSFPAKPASGRLSVPVDFQVPESYVATTFAYTGTGANQERADLDLSYHGRELNTTAPTAVGLFTMLVFWFARRRGYRVALAAFGLFLPLALAPLVPALWQIALEGIFFGSLGGVGLWCVSAVINQIKRLPVSRAALKSAVVVIALLLPATASAQQQATNGKPAHEPQIIVPYDENNQPLAAERVFIPHKMFLELWKQANPERAFVNPTDGLVSSATYAAKLIRNGTDAHMQIRGRFVLHNFRDEQVSVNLPIGQVAVAKAELNGQTAPLRVAMVKVPVSGKNKRASKKDAVATPLLSVVLQDRGDWILDLDFAVPVRMIGPAGRFELKLQPMPSAVMNFELPANDLQLRVNGSSTTWRTGDGKNLAFPVGAGGNLTVEWQPKDEDSGVDRVIHTDVTTVASIDDAGLRVKSKLDYRVRQGTVSEVTFKVPASAILQRVSGPDVGGWQQNATDTERTVRVFLRRSVDSTTSIVVELFTRPEITTAASQIEIPTVEPTEVTREVGQLAVLADPAIVVRSASISGGTQIEPGVFPVPKEFSLKKPLALAWRYRTRPFRVAVSAVRPTAKLRSVTEHAVFVERRKVRYTSRFNLQPQGAPRSRVAVVLPQDFLPLEVFATNLADWYPYKDESGAELLIVDLAAPTLEPIELVVTGTMPREPDEETASISVPRMSEATDSSSQIAIRVDASYTSSVSNSGNWKSVAPATLAPDVRKLSPSNIRFAFQTQEADPAPIALRLSEMPPTLFGESVSVISMTDTSIEYSLNLKWIIRQSASDRFAFSGPDWLAGKLEVRANGLRQVIESEPVDGRVTWTLVLQEPRSTEYFALGVATFPPVGEQNLQTPMLQCEPGTDQTNPIQVQNHYAVVVNQSERLITPLDPNLKAVEPSELQIKIPKEYLSRATQIVMVPKTAPPAWVVTTPERREGAPATVNLADLTTVIASDGSWRTKGVYTIRNRARQFLPLILPDETTLLSVYVKGKPARPVMTTRNNQTLHLIALPRTSEADLSFNVDLVVSGRVPGVEVRGVFNPTGTDVNLPVPEILSLRDDEEFGIPVAMTVWKVHVPSSWHASFLNDASNVTEQDESGSDVIRVMSSLKEAVSQSMAFSNLPSSASSGDGRYLQKQAAAYENLKEAEKILTDNSRSVRNSEVTQELRQLQDNIRDLKAQLGKQGASFNDDASKVELEEHARSKDHDFIEKFNGSLLLGNTATPATNFQKLEDGFRLGLKSTESKRRSGEAGLSKATAGTGTAVTRNGRNRSATKSLRNLNSQIYSVNVPQQGQNASGGMTGQPGNQVGGGGFGGGRFGGARFGAPVAPGNQEPAFYPPTDELFGADGGVRGQGIAPQTSTRERFSIRGGQQSIPLGGDDVVLQPLNDLGAVQEQGVRTGESLQLDQSGEAAWTQAGGLSLPISVSSDSTPMNFSKVGGTPQLTLRVRPAGTMKKGYGLVWAVVWIGLALAALASYRKSGPRGLRRFVPTAMAVIGLMGFILLTGPNATASFVVLTVGTVLMGLSSLTSANRVE